MIEFVFTLDYEIYGNGEGSLRELVLDPTRKLEELFRAFGARFVVFAEAVELPKIEEAGSDPDSAGVRAQLRELRAAGHEIALHLHPWWANGRYERGHWRLDWSERNICVLSPERVNAIVSGAIRYLRDALEDPGFSPVSFRSGLWAMQPTAVMTNALTGHGIRVDSSVFKGGRVNALGLDYRRAHKNGGVWRFTRDVNVPEASGALWEIPIHTQMVPFWRMLGVKRLTLQHRVPSSVNGSPLTRRWSDFLRLRYPRKLDFCRMTFDEMRAAVERDIRRRRAGQEVPAPFVAIGHSKDLVDFDAIERFLVYLRENDVPVNTFAGLLSRELQPPS